MNTIQQERTAKCREIEVLTRSATDRRNELRIQKLQAEIGLLDLQIGVEAGTLISADAVETARREIESSGRQSVSIWIKTTAAAIGTPAAKQFLEDQQFHAMNRVESAQPRIGAKLSAAQHQDYLEGKLAGMPDE